MSDYPETKPVIFGWMKNSSRPIQNFAPDAIYERLFDEVFGDPDATRSHVITLHLYVEYWLDRLLHKLGISDHRTFQKKIETLKKREVLEDSLAKNLEAINKLRNIYSHELDLAAANTHVLSLIRQLNIDPYFVSTDPDRLRAVCIQVMFLLEATYHNDCKPPILSFPEEKVKALLVAEGRLHWQQCEILSLEEHGYIQEYVLRCPYCQKGTIMRERDSTPGFKDSFMTACSECGLTGDGNELELDTVTKRINNT